METIELTTGVVLRIKLPSDRAIARVRREMIESAPRPPMFHNEGKGRDEENPADPDYLNKLSLHDSEYGNKILDIAIATGTEVVTVPTGMFKLEDDGWLENLEFLGIKPANNRLARYVQWVAFYAGSTAKDAAEISAKIRRMMGTVEEEVRVALDSFRSDEERAADRIPAVQVNGSHRDLVSELTPGADT